MKPFYFEYPWTENTEWWLPDDEEMMQNQFKILDEQIDEVLDGIYHTKHANQRTCIQAGGAFGMYPIRLAHHFEKVWTFEPLTANLECLRENMNQFDPLNITVSPNPLWDIPGVKMSMDYAKPVKNSYGAHYLSHSERGEEVWTVTIDQHEIEDVDLIWLDVEGAERYVLEGGVATIAKYRPVVVIEQRQLPHMSHNSAKAASDILVRDHGYEYYNRTHGDVIYLPK